MNELAFERTIDDVVNFGVGLWADTPRGRAAPWLFFVIFVALVLLLRPVPSLPVAAVVAVVVGAPATWVFKQVTPVILANRTRALLTAGEHRSIVGPITVSLEPGALRVRSAVSDSRYEWAAVSRLRRTPAHLGLFITPVSAVVVPRRAFGSPEVEGRFCEELARLSGRRFEG